MTSFFTTSMNYRSVFTLSSRHCYSDYMLSPYCKHLNFVVHCIFLWHFYWVIYYKSCSEQSNKYAGHITSSMITADTRGICSLIIQTWQEAKHWWVINVMVGRSVCLLTSRQRAAISPRSASLTGLRLTVDDLWSVVFHIVGNGGPLPHVKGFQYECFCGSIRK